MRRAGYGSAGAAAGRVRKALEAMRNVCGVKRRPYVTDEHETVLQPAVAQRNGSNV